MLGYFVLVLLVITSPKPVYSQVKQYQIFTDSGSASSALTDCRNRGGDLASIHSTSDNEAVLFQLTESGLSEAWIGLTDFGDEAVVIDGSCTARCDQDCLNKWRWTDGSLNDFTNFGAGQPNSGCCAVFFSCIFDTQDCVVMRIDGSWNDVDCDLSRPYICLFEIGGSPPPNNTGPIDNDLQSTPDPNFTADIILFLSIITACGAGIAFLVYRIRRRRNTMMGTPNPKYDADQRYPESFQPERYNPDGTGYEQARQQRRAQHASTVTNATNRSSAVSLGVVIAQKYFSAFRRSTDSEQLRRQEQEERRRQAERQAEAEQEDSGYQFPVVSRFRL